jgi:hypothetical protein
MSCIPATRRLSAPSRSWPGPCAHICFGSFRRLPYAERTYRWLFPALLHASVQGLSLEFGAREMAEIDLAGK